MIDTNHPIVRHLTERGYQISLHAYLRGGRVKVTVAAKHPETGKLLQGWAKAGDQGGALLDLAKRSKLALGSDPTSMN